MSREAAKVKTPSKSGSSDSHLPANAEDRDLRADLDQAHELVRASY